VAAAFLAASSAADFFGSGSFAAGSRLHFVACRYPLVILRAPHLTRAASRRYYLNPLRGSAMPRGAATGGRPPDGRLL